MTKIKTFKNLVVFSDEQLIKMIAGLKQDTFETFWTIEEADIGGWAGGYPRWCTDDGLYSTSNPHDAKRWLSEKACRESDDFRIVENNSEYHIVTFIDTKKAPVLSSIEIWSVLVDLLATRQYLNDISLDKIESA